MLKEPAHIVSIDLRKHDDNPNNSLCCYIALHFCDGVRRTNANITLAAVDEMLKKAGLTRPSQLIGRHVDIVPLRNGGMAIENIR